MKTAKIKRLERVVSRNETFEVLGFVVQVLEGSGGCAWVQGVYKGMQVQAKIYGMPSEYGIGGGHVSKLWVAEDAVKRAVTVNYDRGWDVGEAREGIWRPLVERLDFFAASEEFKKTVGYVDEQENMQGKVK